MRYEELSGRVGGKIRTKVHGQRLCRGKCIYDKKKRTAAEEPQKKGNLYEDEKCKIKPV